MKSIHEHQLHGTYKPSRHTRESNGNPLTRVPLPPEHLTEDEKRIFKDIAKKMRRSESLGDLDLYTLEQYACQMALFRKAKGELQKPGAEYVSDTVRGKAPSPWMVIFQKSNDALTRLGAQLGLTPQSRGKVSKVEPRRKNDNAHSLVK